MTIVHGRWLAGVAALALLAGGTVTACGSGSSSVSTPTTPATMASGQAGAPGGPGGMDSTQLAAIQKCLTAAGISLPTPPGGQGGGTPPSGAPSGAPTGSAGSPPAGSAGDPPSGGQGGPGGAGGGMFSDAKVVAALKACGITIPTGGPRGAGTASASSSATS